MAKLFLFFSHKLTEEQTKDAKETLAISEIVSLPNEIQTLWSNIPADIADITEFLKPMKEFLVSGAKKGDFVLVQGDCGAVVEMVTFAKENYLIPIYATTTRDVTDSIKDGVVKKISHFRHERFRNY